MTQTKTTRYHLLTEDLLDTIEASPRASQEEWLFLAQSDEFTGRWEVTGLWPDWFFDFEEIVGHYRTVSPAKLEEFLSFAADSGYKIVFTDPPEAILEAYARLRDAPPFSLNSSLDNTIHGMFPWQIEGFNKLVRNESINAGLVVWDTGPQPLSAGVLTPSGYLPMGNLRVGERIIGSDGRPHAVTGVYPQGEQEVFRLTFKDGSEARSTGNHLWGFYDHVGNYSVRRLDEFVAAGLYHARGDAKWFVDRVNPVEFDPQELLIDPYLLGVLLGDGSLTGSSPQLYTHEGEIVPLVENVLEAGMRVSQYGSKHFALVARQPGRYRNTLKYALKDLGLWGHTARTKFVPDEYIYNTVDNRLALLQGLLDTDGNAELQSARFFSISRQLAYDVLTLVRSLGGRAKLSYRDPRQNEIKGKTYNCQEGWIVSLSLPTSMEYFRLDRKILKRRPPVGLNALRSVISIGMQPVQCISVDASDGRYVTENYVLTHNTGKTGFIASALKWHQGHGHPYDLAFVVVKKNNKIDTQRKLKALSDSDSFVIEGTPKKRDKVYAEVSEALEDHHKPVVITNYEGFRQDDEMFKWFMEDRDCLAFWDEMPTRLSNRTTQVYETVQKCLWRTFQPRTGLPTPRPKWLRQWELSATPIENSPEGLFNCVRLMDPLLLGSVTQFDADYVINRNPVSHKPERWGRLDKLEGKIEFMTHRASLADPEIAKLFPEIVEDPLIIDWDSRDRAVYDMLASNAVKILEEESESEEFNVLALIQVMQMICDAPSMIAKSAENHKEFQKVLLEVEDKDEMPRMVKGSEIAVRLVETLKRLPTDDRHTKFETLKEILTEKHPDDKALIYMTWASYGFEPVCRKLDEWGVTYVSYTGTDKQRQSAKDQFRTDPGIQVFLSSDKGSDSIDLPEAAVGVNYNLPWTWTRKRQRQGRNNRVDSQLDTTWWYDLIMANSVEERKQEIIAQKKGYHTTIFDGKAADDAMASKLSREDLIYILTG